MHSQNRRTPRRILPWLLVGALVGAAGLQAATVLFMDLENLVGNADQIYRGEVLASTSGTVFVGGAELPTVTYTLRVDEDFKGNVTAAKEGIRVAEITMLASKSPALGGGGTGLRHVSPLPGLPELTIGQSYVLMTTRPSAVGLSTTVGLGQGTFEIFLRDKVEVVSNETHNAGLVEGSGPMTYDELAQQIRSLVGRR